LSYTREKSSLELMKRVFLAGLGLYIGWQEFSGDLGYWLPAWGTAIDSGYIWGQTALLSLLAMIVFGSVVILGYRGLCWVFE
jgi:hypothetical protein